MHVPTPTLPIGLRLLRNYSGRHLPQDVLAGLLVAALAVPQALGYAVVAGVPVQVGLYTLPPALLAYALFGSSRLLFVGPVSTVSVLSGSIVGALSDGDRALAITLTATLALTAGAVLVAVGLLRLGWVAQFLSEPIVTGFVAGLVVLIVIGEIPALAGVSAPSGGIFQRIDETVRNLGDFHGVTLAVGASALGVLFVGSRLLPRAPWSLIVLAGGIAVSTTGDLASRGVRVVGEVPTGLPLPSMPVVDVQLWSGIITGGIAIAAVGIAEGLAAVRTFAPTGAIDPESDNREFVGHGAANLASGIFGGMGVGGSLSKTAANARAGAFTQVSGVAAAVIVLLFVAFAAALLSDLPRAVLSAIVIHAVWGLVSPSTFRRYAAVRRNDFVAAVVAAVPSSSAVRAPDAVVAPVPPFASGSAPPAYSVKSSATFASPEGDSVTSKPAPKSIADVEDTTCVPPSFVTIAAPEPGTPAGPVTACDTSLTRDTAPVCDVDSIANVTRCTLMRSPPQAPTDGPA